MADDPTQAPRESISLPDLSASYGEVTEKERWQSATRLAAFVGGLVILGLLFCAVFLLVGYPRLEDLKSAGVPQDQMIEKWLQLRSAFISELVSIIDKLWSPLLLTFTTILGYMFGKGR